MGLIQQFLNEANKDASATGAVETQKNILDKITPQTTAPVIDLKAALVNTSPVGDVSVLKQLAQTNPEGLKKLIVYLEQQAKGGFDNQQQARVGGRAADDNIQINRRYNLGK